MENVLGVGQNEAGVQIRGEFSGSIDISHGGNGRRRGYIIRRPAALPVLFRMGNE